MSVTGITPAINTASGRRISSARHKRRIAVGAVELVHVALDTFIEHQATLTLAILNVGADGHNNYHDTNTSVNPAVMLVA
jgi:hypothetical protein